MSTWRISYRQQQMGVLLVSWIFCFLKLCDGIQDFGMATMLRSTCQLFLMRRPGACGRSLSSPRDQYLSKCFLSAGAGRNSLDDFLGSVDELLLAQEEEQCSPAASAGEDGGKWWCSLRLEDLSKEGMNQPNFKASPVDEFRIDGRRIYVKRDDQLRLLGSSICGNKARKLWTLNQCPVLQFPSTIVSFGGPQSNSMLALAAVANFKNRQREEELGVDTNPFRFVYYAKKLPRFLRKQASGNLFRALTLGMELVEISAQEYQDLFGEVGTNNDSDPPVGLAPPTSMSLWVPQGGAFEWAYEGTKRLAVEILEYWRQKQGGSSSLPLSVVVPGGTCTTAVLLHHAIKNLLQLTVDGNDLDIEVVVIPCVGDAAYAQRQMMAMNGRIGVSPGDIPTVLAPAPDYYTPVHKKPVTTYFNFGEPHADILKTYQCMKDEHNLVLDLIYGAPAFTIMQRHWKSTKSPDLSFDPRNPLAGRELMYVHSGGFEGINSQLLRYKYKGLVDLKDIQLP